MDMSNAAFTTEITAAQVAQDLPEFVDPERLDATSYTYGDEATTGFILVGAYERDDTVLAIQAYSPTYDLVESCSIECGASATFVAGVVELMARIHGIRNASGHALGGRQ